MITVILPQICIILFFMHFLAFMIRESPLVDLTAYIVSRGELVSPSTNHDGL